MIHKGPKVNDSVLQKTHGLIVYNECCTELNTSDRKTH